MLSIGFIVIPKKKMFTLNRDLTLRDHKNMPFSDQNTHTRTQFSIPYSCCWRVNPENVQTANFPSRFPIAFFLIHKIVCFACEVIFISISIPYSIFPVFRGGC